MIAMNHGEEFSVIGDELLQWLYHDNQREDEGVDNDVES